jgi:hypothetical protein
MTSPIYDLLPAHIRTRDLEADGAFKALFDLMQREGDLVENDIRALAETWYIETCRDWAIPYIGQLLDVRALHDLGPESGFSARAWVGNTIRSRQRKGTLGNIESVAGEGTGLPARANEMFERLSATQWMNHLRLQRNASALVRDGDRMALTDTAFDLTPRTVDIRRIDRGAGRYNIPNIAIHLWRLQPYRLPLVQAAALSDHQFTLDPLGRDVPLFWTGRTEEDPADIAGMRDLPVRLARRPLYREAEALRQAITDGTTTEPVWFGPNPGIAIEIQPGPGDAFQPVEAAEIAICDIQDAGGGNWRRPPASIDYTTPAGASEARTITAGFDPLRGRVSLPEGSDANGLRATWVYGAPGDLGGGPYDRRLTELALLGRDADFQVGVTTRLPTDGTTLVPSVAEAVALWNARPAGEAGLIVLMDNDRFEEDLTGPDAVILGEGSALAIVSADWPEEHVPGGGTQRRVGVLSARDRRAAFVGPMEIVTEATLGAALPNRFVINGLLMDGALTFEGAASTAFGRIDLAHLSISPSHTLTLSIASIEDSLTLTRCITGRLNLGTVETDLHIVQSIVDGNGGPAITASAVDLDVNASTLIGATGAGEVEAVDTIFDGPLVAERTQAGCLQYSYYAPIGSRTPRRYRCQPDLALAGRPPATEPGILAGLRPLYAADSFGDPDYGRLSDRAAAELLTGASDNGAMGAWGFMKFGWRETNLAIATQEYLPFGLMAGSVYET